MGVSGAEQFDVEEEKKKNTQGLGVTEGTAFTAKDFWPKMSQGKYLNLLASVVLSLAAVVGGGQYQLRDLPSLPPFNCLLR
jgi:hypothetical protein